MKPWQQSTPLLNKGRGLITMQSRGFFALRSPINPINKVENSLYNA
jgi:hypothetical protein